MQSADDWRRLLRVTSRLHRFSANNAMLIAVQHAAAFDAGRVTAAAPTFVAGFQAWKALDRSVVKGQKGYSILAPVPRSSRVAVAGDGPGAVRRPLASGGELRAGEKLELEQRLSFRIEHVFDVSQTSGAPLPDRAERTPLAGEAPAALISELARFAGRQGYTVAFVDDAVLLGGADGVTRFDARSVTVRTDMAGVAVATTLAHELGHVLLHDPQRDPGEVSVHRGIGEVEAESVAFVVMAAHGVDSSSETLPYIATWAPGRTPAATVQATAQRVINAAHTVLTAIDTAQIGDGAPPGLATALAARGRPRADIDSGAPALTVGI